MTCPKCSGFMYQDSNTFWWLQDTHCVNCGHRPNQSFPVIETDPEMQAIREQGRLLAIGELKSEFVTAPGYLAELVA